MIKLSESKIKENKDYAEKHNMKVDENGYLVCQENVPFKIDAKIEVQDND